MKDYTVKYLESIIDDYSNIQYLLVPCDVVANTFILIAPNPYMLKMRKAKIIVESVVHRYGYDEKDHYYPIGKLKKYFHNYTDMIQYLFSIEKTKYFNSLLNMERDCIQSIMQIKYCFFSIRLYDEKDHVIYKKKINLTEETQLSEIYISTFLSPREILNQLQEIYFSELSLYKENLSIDTINHIWNMDHEKYRFQLCGMWLDETNSIRFFQKDDIHILERISYLCGFIHTFPEKSSDVILYNMIDFNFVYYDPQLAIEFFTYLPYLQLAMQLCVKLANVEYGYQKIEIDDIYIRHFLEIEIFSKREIIKFDSDQDLDILNVIEVYKRREE